LSQGGPRRLGPLLGFYIIPEYRNWTESYAGLQEGKKTMTDFERFEQIIDEWFAEDDLD